MTTTRTKSSKKGGAAAGFRAVRAALRPGRIYLTIGTTQQIHALLQLETPTSIVSRCHYNPTSQTFRRLLLPNPLVGAGATAADVVFYSALCPTGRIRTRGANYGTVQNTNEETLGVIPNDQTVVVPPNRLVFVVLGDPITGEVDRGLMTKAKSLDGGVFELLDLRRVDFEIPDTVPAPVELANRWPISARWHAELLESDPGLWGTLAQQWTNAATEARPWDPETERVVALFDALTQPNGHQAWWDFGVECNTYKWFLVYTSPTPTRPTPIPLGLNTGRAWGLAPYLEPYLDAMRQNLAVGPLMLARFASWVWACNNAWAEPGAEGLTKTNGWRAKQPYWTFKPSVRARREASKIEEDLRALVH